MKTIVYIINELHTNALRSTMKIRWFILVCLIFFTGAVVASAGVEYDLNDSIKVQSFKGTHNSYDQPHSIPEQMDRYNVWCLELDLCGVDENNRIEVQHGCFASFKGFFTEFLQDILTSDGWNKRVTFIWLDIKETCLRSCNWRGNTDNDRANLIAQNLKDMLGEHRIYSKTDWDADYKVWPSIQALLNRGKYFICIYDNNDHNPDHPLLFVSAHQLGKIFSYTAFLNVKNADVSTFPGYNPTDNDQFLWRSYDLNEQSEWDSAADSGIHLLSTDQYLETWTFTDKSLPPVPMYVDVVAPGQEFGTFSLPFGVNNLQNAINSSAKNSRFVIAPGNYNTSVRFDRLMTPEIGTTGAPGSATSGNVIIGQD